MNTVTIGNVQRAGKNWQYPVRLDGYLTGVIRKTVSAARTWQYQYKPMGAKGGEQFATLELCVASLRS